MFKENNQKGRKFVFTTDWPVMLAGADGRTGRGPLS